MVSIVRFSGEKGQSDKSISVHRSTTSNFCRVRVTNPTAIEGAMLVLKVSRNIEKRKKGNRREMKERAPPYNMRKLHCDIRYVVM